MPEIAWVLIGSVLLFLVMFFVFIPFSLARIGGWKALASEYRLKGDFEGTRWWYQEITLRGWCGYNGCVSVGANAEGLYINTIFWVSHPPLFFPWAELSGKRREVKLFKMRIGLVDFRAQRVPNISLTLRESLVQKIVAAYASALRAETLEGQPEPAVSPEVLG
jgi:hypothetical protein